MGGGITKVLFLISLTELPSYHTDKSVFICFIALEHYVNMYTASLSREAALMGLNRASGEGNLTGSDECPVTYVILSHTQVDVNIMMQKSR